MLRATRGVPVLRVGLHPADVAHPALMHTWRAVLRTLLAERECSTKSAVLRMQPTVLHEARIA